MCLSITSCSHGNDIFNIKKTKTFTVYPVKTEYQASCNIIWSVTSLIISNSLKSEHIRSSDNHSETHCWNLSRTIIAYQNTYIKYLNIFTQHVKALTIRFASQ